MPVYLIIVICVVAAMVLFFAAALCAAFYVQKKAFCARFEKLPHLKYFTAEEFSLNSESVQTKAGKISLGGYIYADRPLSDCRALVIFAHGMGAGQCCYTTEIAYFCRHGCAVLAFDSIGCTLSQGKVLGGMENAVKSLVAAVRYAQSSQSLKMFKKFLVGHSMGGYAALCAAAQIKVDGVISFSAPDIPADITAYGAAGVIGRGAAALLKPFLRIVSVLKFRRYANKSASRAAKLSGVPALIFHGDGDKIVPLSLSAYKRLENSGAERVLCEGKGHNPYNTIRAEKLLAELVQGLSEYPQMSEQEREHFFSSRDYYAVCEEDETVMGRAVKFIEFNCRR